MSDQKESFFEKEKARLVGEISSGFEELLTLTNVLNRKMEEVYGLGREMGTVAELWGSFSGIVKSTKEAPPADNVPGTGGVTTLGRE